MGRNQAAPWTPAHEQKPTSRSKADCRHVHRGTVSTGTIMGAYASRSTCEGPNCLANAARWAASQTGHSPNSAKYQKFGTDTILTSTPAIAYAEHIASEIKTKRETPRTGSEPKVTTEPALAATEQGHQAPQGRFEGRG